MSWLVLQTAEHCCRFWESICAFEQTVLEGFWRKERVNKPLLQVGRLTQNCNSSHWAAGDVSQSRFCLVDTCLCFLFDKSKQTDCKLLLHLRSVNGGNEARNQVCQVIADPSGILPPWDGRQHPQIDSSVSCGFGLYVWSYLVQLKHGYDEIHEFVSVVWQGACQPLDSLTDERPLITSSARNVNWWMQKWLWLTIASDNSASKTHTGM